MPGPSALNRWIWAPVRSAGWRSCSLASRWIARYSGWLRSKLSSAVVSSVPIRSLSCVDGDLVGEHVLAGVLVAAVAGEALLVAVVDDGLAAGEEHQRVGQLRPGQQLGVGRRRAGRPVGGSSRCVPCRGSRGTSAWRRRCCRRRCSSRRSAKNVAQVVGRRALRGEPAGGELEAEVDRRLQLPSVENSLMNGGPNCWSNTSPKAKKSSMPRAVGGGEDVGPEHLPELHVHVLGGVDAEPVDAELLDPEASRCRPSPRPPRGAPSTGRRGRRSRRRASSHRRSWCCPRLW